MLNVAICDDDKISTGKLESYLREIISGKIMDIDVFWGGEYVVKSIQGGINYDIIFLDIEMKKLDGITTAREIRKIDRNVLIIYVTNHNSYMKQSFDVQPFRFLTKPVNFYELKKSFLDAYQEFIKYDSYFRYRYKRINYKILFKDIIYFESQKRKIFIITKDGQQCMYGKLNSIQKDLLKSNALFLRVHQSFLVNYLYIEKQAYDFVITKTNQRIPISEDRRKSISKQYCEMGSVHGL